MKKKLLYLCVIMATFIACLICLNTTSYGYQSIDSLTYEVELNEDGTANVTEIWEDTYISYTNTLFKTFELDEDKFEEITNVKVSEVSSTGIVTDLIQTDTYAYHVTEGYYYALEVDDDEFEIAWGVGLDNSSDTRTYQISYTITNAVKVYNDCTEFYWMFLSEDNSISVDYVEGRIKLPSSVSDSENLKVWAHGPLNGEIRKINKQEVYFNLDYLSTGTMLEVRVVTTENIYPTCTNIIYSNELENIIEEETEWADEANAEREAEAREEAILEIVAKIVAVIINLVIIGVTVLIIWKMIKYIKILKDTEKINSEEKYEYYRDFPDETASPSEAAYLYYFDKSKFKKNISNIVSATILDLALKKKIELVKKDEKNIEIEILSTGNGEGLPIDESSIYSLLIRVREYINAQNKTKKNYEPQKTISMKDIEKYAKYNDTRFLSEIEGLENEAKIAQVNKGNINIENEKTAQKWKSKRKNYYMAALICVCCIAFIVPIIWMPFFIVCAILCGKISNKMVGLTQEGANEQEKWRGLKRYMENFSMLDEREVPELALWDKYLVYATAFGISDKVLKQLEIKYPNMLDENFMMNNGYGYIYMINTYHFDRAINTSMNRAYRAGESARAARNMSSGGGSFSSGSGRRRRVFSDGGRRTVAVAAGMGGR